MIDIETKQPLQVRTDGTIWPYITLPADQLDALRQILDQHGFRYEVDEVLISFDGRPEEALVNFRRGTDAAAVQRVLDKSR